MICGLIQDQPYFDEKIKPYCDGSTVIYYGNADPVERDTIMGAASALLHPISFEEPFGLSVVESMLCGTPVIAFNRGSMKELVAVNRSGFLVEGIDEAVAAVAKISTINRTSCREHALARFTSDQMTERYIRLYDQILSKDNQ